MCASVLEVTGTFHRAHCRSRTRDQDRSTSGSEPIIMEELPDYVTNIVKTEDHPAKNNNRLCYKCHRTTTSSDVK